MKIPGYDRWKQLPMWKRITTGIVIFPWSALIAGSFLLLKGIDFCYHLICGGCLGIN